MPVSITHASAAGIALEPRDMADARGHLVKVCWTHNGQHYEHTDEGFWWMRFGAHSLRICAPFPAGATLELHWK